MSTVIGRKHEQGLLENILQSGEPELVVVYGRRRVGKTFLVKNVYEKQLAFDFSCIHNAILSQQFENLRQHFHAQVVIIWLCLKVG